MRSIVRMLFISLIAVATVTGCASTPYSSTEAAKAQQDRLNNRAGPLGYER